jgi:hypothetical protein
MIELSLGVGSAEADKISKTETTKMGRRGNRFTEKGYLIGPFSAMNSLVTIVKVEQRFPERPIYKGRSLVYMKKALLCNS